jgi:TRAP-type C4-dicarboxylate transport system substrate-binding protein
LSDSLKADLTAKGITFIDIDREAFRKALAGTPFYADWKKKYGDAAWGTLEKTVGKLG